jgi:ectoine hydroxylase-related dioxygenase (phytanoyl-CoA dioxygenase family)
MTVIIMPITTRSMSKILHQKGYVIYRNVLPDLDDSNILESLREHMNETSGPIFNNEKTNDNRRRQNKLTTRNPVIRNWVYSIEETLRSIHPLKHLTFREWNILQSLSGCESQQAHTDYVPTEKFVKKMLYLDVPENHNKIPLLCLIALEPNTYLDVWENSTRLITSSDDKLKDYVNPDIRSNRLCLQAGDVLLFRPDLIHAGSSYLEENIRLHVYLDSEEIPRQTNRTFIINKHGGHLLRSMFSQNM